MDALARLREQGKIRHVGLSNVTREHVERARRIVPIVSVQNRYSFADRESDFIVEYCEQNELPSFPGLHSDRPRRHIPPSSKRRRIFTRLRYRSRWLGSSSAPR